MNAAEPVKSPANSIFHPDTVNLKPKKGCSKCYGTGRVGFLNGDKKQAIPCKCIRKQAKALEAQGKLNADTRISIGEAGPAGVATPQITTGAAGPAGVSTAT